MNILFLDFDGVLVNRKSWYVRSGGHATADAPCVEALNYITVTTGAVIVVSSTWRIGTSAADIRATLRSWGVVGTVLGCTPSVTRKKNGEIYISRPRGEEIRKWLDGNSARFNVDRIVILDDEAEGIGEQLQARLVKTDFEIGLTMDHARRAIEMFEANATPQRE